MENNEKKNPLAGLMEATMSKIHEMADSNTVIGSTITTPDGVTLIPVSRLSLGFGSGGGDYGTDKFGGGTAAGVKMEPVAFLVVKDGVTRVLPVGLPAVTTVDRLIDMVPEMMDRLENFVEKKKEKEDF